MRRLDSWRGEDFDLFMANVFLRSADNAAAGITTVKWWSSLSREEQDTNLHDRAFWRSIRSLVNDHANMFDGKTVKEFTEMLNTKAMLVSLTITKWGITKKDTQATAKVAEVYQADEKKAGAYNKSLVDRNNPTLKMLYSLTGEIRNYVYSRTMPWSEEGQRILPVGIMFEMQQKLEDYAREWERVVNEFCTNEYPNLVSAARIHLGALYDTQDYPSPSQIRAKFSLSVSFAPLPAGEDFRVAISEEERKRIADEIEENTKQACMKATEDLTRRVIERVRHMAESLSDYAVEKTEDGKTKVKNPFRDSLVENVREIADLIPKMNFTDDPALAEAVKDIKAKLVTHDAEALRASPMLRQDTAQAAKDILTKLNVL